MKATSSKIGLGHARFLTGKKNVFITIIFAFLIVFSAFPQFGCKDGWAGKNPDLYTVAINTLPFSCGFSAQTDFLYDPEIKVIERNNSGKILFSYTERCFHDRKLSYSALLVCQKSENENVYFYPNSYYIKQKDLYNNSAPSFTAEEIEHVKDINDWNAEFDLAKCAKRQNVIAKNTLYISKATYSNSFSGIDDSIKNSVDWELFTTSNNNVQLFCSYNQDSYYIAIAENKEFLKAIKIENPYDCINQIKQFKQENGWDDLCKE